MWLQPPSTGSTKRQIPAAKQLWRIGPQSGLYTPPTGDIKFMRQCDGVWHFPWSRNACGIYSSLWLYIPINCMLSSVLVYCHFRCTAGWGARTCNITHNVAVKYPQWPFYFLPWLFTHLSTADISELDSPLCARFRPCCCWPVSLGPSVAAELQCCPLMAQLDTAVWHIAALWKDCANWKLH